MLIRMAHRKRMKTITHASVAVALAVVATTFLNGCAAVTHHEAVSMSIGVPGAASSLEADLDVPGPVAVETVVGAEWHVPRSGLLNLDHPKAKAAGLGDGEEPILIMFHAVRHPTRGLFLVDTGAERALRTPEKGGAAIQSSRLVAKLAHLDDMVVRTDTASWIARQNEPVRGVFLTHLHLDHVSGMRDLPPDAPVFVGPGETEGHAFMNLFTSGITDRALEGKGPLQALRFAPDPDGRFDGVLDVFGDRSFWAIWVPGHTAGSVAFVARTPHGPVLLTGDACHTAWGWQHGVEPGSFSDDRPASARSLARLEGLAARHPSIDVRLGHQQLPVSHVQASLSATTTLPRIAFE
jgi:glyoxylase-like metal-dependent hydrolase (beta-lactamase superfamily II)